MKIKRSEIDAAIAVEVMGWDYRGTERRILRDKLERYHFSTDLNHAREALEGWRKINPSCRHSDIGVGFGKASVSMLEGMKTISRSIHESLAVAICLALLSAVRGETVELEQ